MIVDLGCFLALWKLLSSVWGVSKLSLFSICTQPVTHSWIFAKSCGGRVRLPAVEHAAVGLSKHLKKTKV